MRTRTRLFLLSSAAMLAMVGGGFPSASARSADAEVVEMRDKCEPSTFNEVIGPGTCATRRGVGPGGVRFRPGNVTFEEFAEDLNPVDFGHRAWKFRPKRLDIDEGDAIVAVNTGGEDHTFTEAVGVDPDALGRRPARIAGCVDPINQALALTGPPPTDCATAFTETAAHPGGSVTVRNLAPGDYLFYCVIHPWMQTTVEVERDD